MIIRKRQEPSVMPIHNTDIVYDFPVFQKMKDVNGELVEVEVGASSYRLSDLIRQRDEINEKIKAIDALEKPIEEPTETVKTPEVL